MGPDQGALGVMSEPSLDDRFDTREEEVQHYRDWIEDCRPRWDPAEKKRFARTVVRLKEQSVDRDSDVGAPTA